MLPPTGELIWRQRRAPLGLLLQRFDNAPLERHETVTASSAQLTGEEYDWFAPGSFAELNDAEAVNRRSFERLPGGIRLGAGADTASGTVVHQVIVEEFRLPEPQPKTVDAFVPPGWLLRAADMRVGIGGGDRPAPQIGVPEEPWQVRGAGGQVLAETASSSQAHQLASAAGDGAAAVPAGDVVTLSSL